MIAAQHQHTHSASGDADATGGRVRDPVCGMMVEPATAKYRAAYRGQDYFFCSDGCRRKFIADPPKYTEPRPAAASAGTATDQTAIYTCPMHPEIQQRGPGACPICGMALEPEMASAIPAANPELADMTRRFWIALALAVPVMILDMSAHFGAHWLSPSASNIVQFALATPVVLWAGWPFFLRGARSLRTRNLNMFTLIALGTGIAWLYSVAVTFAPRIFPAALTGHNGAVPVYFEAAAMITVLVLLGQVLELRAREATSGAIRALLDLAPATARRVKGDGGDDTEIALDEVRRDDKLRVRPGDKVPVDGIVIEGHSSLDQSMVSGEAMPASKGPGDSVIGGTFNISGGFVMRAEKVGRDTLLAQIVQMVATAQRSRAPIQRLADRVAALFVPLVIAAALVAFTAWAVLGPQPRLGYALIAAVSVLIIACPCALGLATPMSIMVGVGRGAQTGILIRNAQTLERLHQVDTLLIDKTGTLTQGKPKLASIAAAPGVEETEALRLAANLERPSEHPLAAAIVAAAAARDLPIASVSGFDASPGKGAIGMTEGKRLAIGSAAFLRELGIETGALGAAAEQARRDGATAVFLAVDGKAAAMFAIADPIKDTAPAALATLAAAGLRIVMVTGDNLATAQAIARRLGVRDIEAEVLPERKAELVARFRGEGRVVAMAGDGVNDAPALAAADVGIAMGTGSDVAIESAGITLLKGDLDGIVRARALSRAVMRNIRQNLFFAFIYNAAGVPIAAGVLYPVFGIVLSPILAAAAMALSSASVVGNALRLRGVKL